MSKYLIKHRAHPEWWSSLLPCDRNSHLRLQSPVIKEECSSDGGLVPRWLPVVPRGMGRHVKASENGVIFSAGADNFMGYLNYGALWVQTISWVSVLGETDLTQKVITAVRHVWGFLRDFSVGALSEADSGHLPTLGTCKDVVSHGKGELRLKMEWRLLTSWPWDGEITLDWPDGTDVITSILKSGRGQQKGRSLTQWETDSTRYVWLWR